MLNAEFYVQRNCSKVPGRRPIFGKSELTKDSNKQHNNNLESILIEDGGASVVMTALTYIWLLKLIYHPLFYNIFVKQLK
jgi:hypothetical protein